MGDVKKTGGSGDVYSIWSDKPMTASGIISKALGDMPKVYDTKGAASALNNYLNDTARTVAKIRQFEGALQMARATPVVGWNFIPNKGSGRLVRAADGAAIQAHLTESMWAAQISVFEFGEGVTITTAVLDTAPERPWPPPATDDCGVPKSGYVSSPTKEEMIRFARLVGRSMTAGAGLAEKGDPSAPEAQGTDPIAAFDPADSRDMVAAAVRVVKDHGPFYPDLTLALEIYRAMRALEPQSVVPTYYDISYDEKRPVTQAVVDNMERCIKKLVGERDQALECYAKAGQRADEAERKCQGIAALTMSDTGSHDYHGPLGKPDNNGRRVPVPDPVHEQFHRAVGDVLAGKVMPAARRQMQEALKSAPKEATTIPTHIDPGDQRRIGWLGRADDYGHDPRRMGPL